jgi:hypothetical protein
MSKRSKLVCLIVALLFIFTSLAGGAFAAVQIVAIDSDQSDVGFHLDGSLGTPAYSIAGDCDMAAGCGIGSG